MGARRPRPPSRPAPGGPSEAQQRFRRLDDYRVQREWARYEGTAQRDLFRQLRERFLVRHARSAGWALEVGPGPGRFTPMVGTDGRRRVAMDLSIRALRSLRDRWSAHGRRPPPPEGVLGDASAPPFRPSTFSVVSLLGNVVGFAGAAGPELLERCARLVAPGGQLLVEVDCGPGEQSRYLARLPPGAVRRLLASPPGLVSQRIRREGFRRVPEDELPRGVRREVPAGLTGRLESLEFGVQETLAVAPALGLDPLRLEAVHADPSAWERLLSIEEELGRDPARIGACPAVLVSARRAQAQH